ncbi:recombination protein U [Ligilactobacillus sp. WC1T17]|uniref:Holliday junction resolvase RecU n=1 Tax=Ligilactobacillus ruminis TaxID=1623 RepID=A0ABY1AAA2_9LACO|nr:recombination protein U [Ligilactobacillus ruminis]
MGINYPNGQPFKKNATDRPQKSQHVLYGNRGMSLEAELNESNKYYLDHGIAVIHKKPIPIQIVDVSYPKRSAAVIREAYFKQASTTDYNGVYHGKYLDFDAKETKNKVSFPLKNFHKHQIEHMRACQKQGGICFAIVKFVTTNQLFLLPCDVLFEYWDQQATGRKSIPKEVISKRGFEIFYRLAPKIAYLDGVDQLLKQIKKD